MTSLIGDVKFTADMILELLENFDKDYQGDLNSFKEGECLECLSAEDISLRLNKRFEVDVDRVRAILKREEALSNRDQARGRLGRNGRPGGRNFALNGTQGEVGVSLKKKNFFFFFLGRLIFILSPHKCKLW